MWRAMRPGCTCKWGGDSHKRGCVNAAPVRPCTESCYSTGMADFVKLSIFGTVFEVTTRYVDLQPVGMGAFGLVCSAKDTLTDQSVAVKKIMKPFSTPVLAKRTYRELKLLKHIRHENVGGRGGHCAHGALTGGRSSA